MGHKPARAWKSQNMYLAKLTKLEDTFAEAGKTPTEGFAIQLQKIL